MIKKILKIFTALCARALSESESQMKLEVSAKPTGRLNENEPKAKFELSRVVVPAIIAVIANYVNFRSIVILCNCIEAMVVGKARK